MMTISQRLTALETKMKYMERTMYFIAVVVLADLGITII